jgi:ATP-dependent helicase/nuclease subunit B
MRAFSNPYINLNFNGSVIDINNLYSISTSLKISVDREYWKKRINERMKQIEIEQLDTADQFEIDVLQKEYRRMQKALTDILSIDNILRRFSSDMTPSQFISKLKTLLDELSVSQNILGNLQNGVRETNVHRLEQIEKDARAYQTFFNVLDDLLDVFEIQNKSDVLHPLKLYIEQLKTSISQTRYNIRQKYGYGVYVTSLEETRGLEFDFMFVVGLVDGEFPPIYQPEIFFSQPRQNKKEKYHLTENRYLFYQCITNFKNKLFVTFPKKDGDMEFVPSSFIDSLLKIIRCNDWRTEIPSELDNIIYSEEELLARIGKNRGAGYEQPLDIQLQENILNTIKHIFHSIEIEKGRLKPDDKLEFKGYIYNKLKPAAKECLENMKQKTYSISQLEKYAGCPFKYFMDQILYLNVVKELEEGITPLEKGTILHEVLFKFYIDRRSNGLPPLVDCSEAEYQEAVAKLITLTEEKLNSLPETDLFTFLEKELILGTSASRGIVHEFLDNERNRKLEVAPSFFEVPIGKRIGDRQNTDNLLYSEEAVQVGNVKIRGKVDRIDTGNNYFTVIDYKTGSSVPNIDDIRSGLSLQLPVYLYVIETLFSKKFQKELSPAAGLYYVLTSPVKEELGVSNKELDGKAFNLNKRRKGFVDNEEELITLIHQSIKFVNEYAEAISRGEFPITTEDKMKTVCNYCEFDRICRKQTLLK